MSTDSPLEVAEPVRGQTPGTQTLRRAPGLLCRTDGVIMSMKEGATGEVDFSKSFVLLRGGILVPGHEPRIWADPESLGFRKVSEHAVAIVE